MSTLDDLARGWFRKGDSDRSTAELVAGLEELVRRCASVNPAPDLSGIDLTILTPYAQPWFSSEALAACRVTCASPSPCTRRCSSSSS
jgi:hypothetical protein